MSSTNHPSRYTSPSQCRSHGNVKLQPPPPPSATRAQLPFHVFRWLAQMKGPHSKRRHVSCGWRGAFRDQLLAGLMWLLLLNARTPRKRCKNASRRLNDRWCRMTCAGGRLVKGCEDAALHPVWKAVHVPLCLTLSSSLAPSVSSKNGTVGLLYLVCSNLKIK